MHLNTNPEHWNNYYYFAFLFYENTSFLRTAQMGVHHMVLLRTDCYTVTLQDSCLGVHLLTGPSCMETVKTSIRFV